MSLLVLRQRFSGFLAYLRYLVFLCHPFVQTLLKQFRQHRCMLWRHGNCNHLANNMRVPFRGLLKFSKPDPKIHSCCLNLGRVRISMDESRVLDTCRKFFLGWSCLPCFAHRFGHLVVSRPVAVVIVSTSDGEPDSAVERSQILAYELSSLGPPSKSADSSRKSRFVVNASFESKVLRSATCQSSKEATFSSMCSGLCSSPLSSPKLGTTEELSGILAS